MSQKKKLRCVFSFDNAFYLFFIVYMKSLKMLKKSHSALNYCILRFLSLKILYDRVAVNMSNMRLMLLF